MMSELDEAKNLRIIGSTIFKAGAVSLVGDALVFLYLSMVAGTYAAFLCSGLLLVVVVVTFAFGAVIYNGAVRRLKQWGERSPGIMRRQPQVLESAFSSSDEEEFKRLLSDYRE